MKKYIKILLFILVIFNVDNNVYADNTCYYMLGYNNKTIIPNGYYGYCGTYALDTGLSTIEEGKNFPSNSSEFELLYTRESDNGVTGVTLKYSSSPGYFADFTFRDNKYEQEYIQQDIQVESWDGLHFDEVKSKFDSVIIDSNISGCPKIIYWSDNDYNARTIGFCADESCERTGERIFVYKLNKSNTNLLYTTDINNPQDNLKNSVDLRYEIANCTEIEKNESTGQSGYIDNTTTSTTITTLKTCKYYFEIDSNASNNCRVDEIELVYNKVQKAGVTTFEVTTGFAGLDLQKVKDALVKIKSNDVSTYSNAKDYLVYKNGTWSCPDKMYIIKDTGGAKRPILGYTDYTQYPGASSAAEESHNSSENLCSKPIPPADNNSKDDFDWEFSEDETCEGVLGKDLVDFINKIFRWICIIAPIIVIVMGSVDFAGAVLQDDRDALKKASSKFIKRLIIAIVLFFIPILLSFFFDIYKVVTGKTIVLCKIWR